MLGLKKLFTGNKFGIPQKVLAKLGSPPPRTPDYSELISRKHNLVFLYGNDMTTGREKLSVMPLYKDVYTYDPFVMVKVKEGQKTVPAVLNPPPGLLGTISRLPRGRVKGELYQLTADEIAELDRERQNGLIFNRIRAKIRVEYCTISQHKRGEQRISEPLFYEKRVHMYLGNYDYFSYAKIQPYSFKLFKTRDNNELYEPRYYYTPQDWE